MVGKGEEIEWDHVLLQIPPPSAEGQKLAFLRLWAPVHDAAGRTFKYRHYTFY
jgi:hypothetical protein